MLIEEDIKRVLACKDDLNCPCEASCYRMAEFIEKIINKPKIDAKIISDIIEYYAPTWENARP